MHLLHELEAQAVLSGELYDSMPVSVRIPHAHFLDGVLSPSVDCVSECGLRLRSVLVEVADEVFLDVLEYDEAALALHLQLTLLL